jgi:FMN-dependent oxidoreductase (nitrilotriacetate monooxygenase family)
MQKRKMHLIAYLKTGPTALHAGGWRHPESVPEDMFSPIRYEQQAQMFEAACLDGFFFADLFGFADTYGGGVAKFAQAGGQNSYLDPMTVLPIMARATRHLGLGVTVSTSFHSAFHIARSLASVDLLSGGRVAWNLVTSTTDLEARNVGMDTIPPHGERYDRAEEALEACMALWRTWDPDPFVYDKEKGVFADPSKIHYANYSGKYVKSRGPLPSPQSPQGHPVIMQAGSSERGREFAAKHAEIVFASGYDKASMREFYLDMHRRLADAGRDPATCKMFPSVTPVIGETESIAREKLDYLNSLADPEYNKAYASLSLGADLGKHKSLEEVTRAQGNQGTRGGQADLAKVAQASGVSIAEASEKMSSRKFLVGTPKMVADMLEDLFVSEACDGFIIMPIVHPGSHEQFCRAVVPELQRRGLFRKEYAASTLRGNLQS